EECGGAVDGEGVVAGVADDGRQGGRGGFRNGVAGDLIVEVGAGVVGAGVEGDGVGVEWGDGGEGVVAVFGAGGGGVGGVVVRGEVEKSNWERPPWGRMSRKVAPATLPGVWMR